MVPTWRRQRLAGHGDALLRLLDLQDKPHRVVRHIQAAVEAAEVGASQGALMVLGRPHLPANLACREPTPQLDTAGAEEEEGAEALPRSHAPLGVEDKLEPLDTRRIEGGAADGLPLRERRPEHRGVLDAPVDLPYHSRRHGVHPVPHKVQQAVVDMAVGHGKRLQRPVCIGACAALPSLRASVHPTRCFDLARDLQDLEGDGQHVTVCVCLGGQETQWLRRVTLPIGKEVLQLGCCVAHIQLEEEAEALSCPNTHYAIACCFDTGHWRVLQFHAEPVNACYAEFWRAPTQAGLGCKVLLLQPLGDLAEAPLDLPRGDARQLRDRRAETLHVLL
mmetsp:Transcript_70933/g.211493  ORF Transcript_70933/g.211493 Transcript_70933/m.211493 type:complete len:334 (-) Transcript_70933:1052-2053(-)